MLKPISTCPKDGSYFVAWGPSGYTTTLLRCEVCRWDEKFRPKNPLVNHANDAFTDGGEAATHWSELQKEEMTEFEHSILEEVAGLKNPSPWGASVVAALEFLHKSGYTTTVFGNTLTRKGHEYLFGGDKS
jgi:hypothetical protein